jgi:hypothetical protein
MTKYKISVYFHNPSGPAIHRLKDNVVEYWLEGELLTKEAGEKIAHNFNFKNKLTDTINE